MYEKKNEPNTFAKINTIYLGNKNKNNNYA